MIGLFNLIIKKDMLNFSIANSLLYTAIYDANDGPAIISKLISANFRSHCIYSIIDLFTQSNMQLAVVSPLPKNPQLIYLPLEFTSEMRGASNEQKTSFMKIAVDTLNVCTLFRNLISIATSRELQPAYF
jgi:hypothetical protein